MSTPLVAVTVVNVQVATEAALLRSAGVGDRVTIRVPNGIGRNGVEWKEATGRVVIKSHDRLALNMGGRFGKPGVATVENIVRVRKAA